ncbi:hypothetical protein KFU94_38265 [Chloroflexi bacterium TSY]|nr:hypothetical protein [Chloroflexi bacterium TSY]MBV7333983.1 hypothetical protein [Chloroflexi bacterium TSY]
MSKRISVYVDEDIPGKLLDLVDGPRKQGEYISNLVRTAWENRQVSRGTTIEGLRFQVVGLMAEVQDLRSRITVVPASV